MRRLNPLYWNRHPYLFGYREIAHSLFWGAGHALDIGGGLLKNVRFGGPEQDARALAGDWRRALRHADREIDGREAEQAGTTARAP